MYAKVQDFRNLDDEGDDVPPVQGILIILYIL